MPSLKDFVVSSTLCQSGIILAILLTVVYRLYLWASPKPLPGIPYDLQAARSFAGDLTTLQKEPGGLPKWCSKHLAKLGSPVCQVMIGPFGKPIVLIADIGETRDIMMRKDFDRSSYMIDGFPLFGGSQIRMHTNEAWRTSRGWLKDLLTPQFMQTIAGPEIHSSVCRLIELWEISSRVAGPEKQFCMLQDLKCMALDIMTQFHHGGEFQDLALKRQITFLKELETEPSTVVYGPDNEVILPRAHMNDFSEGIEEIGDKMAAIYTMIWPTHILSWWLKHISPRYRRFFLVTQKFLRKRFDTAIERLRRGEEPKTAIDFMVFREEKAAIKAGRRPVYEEQIMVDEVFSNHLAGLHNTSAAMVWILKFLTENQDVQVQLRNELQESFPIAALENRFPTSVELISSKLPYLEAVIEETLRLRSAFLIARDAVRDTELLGYMIPKGTVCLLVCQDIEYFSALPTKSTKPARHYLGNGNPDLKVFDPERWLVRKDGQVRFDSSGNSQMAFGLGIRACWGRKIAEFEMKMAIAMVVWNFNILDVPEALKGHDAVYDFSYRAKAGFLHLEKRGDYDKLEV